MEKFLVGLGLGGILLLLSVIAILVWKFSNFFIARREFYVKSPYEIFLKKTEWYIFWVLIALMVLLGLLDKFT